MSAAEISEKPAATDKHREPPPTTHSTTQTHTVFLQYFRNYAFKLGIRFYFYNCNADLKNNTGDLQISSRMSRVSKLEI